MTKLEELTALLPGAMADLMREFIERKDLNSRTDVRLRMLGLLDFASADTTYPANPLTQKDDPGGDARRLAMDQGPAVAPYLNGQQIGGVAYRPVAAVPAVAPIPGARRIDNSGILGS